MHSQQLDCYHGNYENFSKTKEHFLRVNNENFLKRNHKRKHKYLLLLHNNNVNGHQLLFTCGQNLATVIAHMDIKFQLLLGYR